MTVRRLSVVVAITSVLTLAMGAIGGCNVGNEPSPRSGNAVGADSAHRELRFLTPCVDTSECSSRCDGGDAPSCGRFSDLVDRQMGPSGEPTHALQIFEQSCVAGVASGCHRAGASYRDGLGVERDETKAVGYFQKGCDGGNAEACLNLASFYENARGGLSEDPTKAITLVKKACDSGFLSACVQMATRITEGRDTERDPAKAAAILKQAAERGEQLCAQGDGRACLLSARLVKDQGDARSNFTRIIALQQKGCDIGVVEACEDAAETLTKAPADHGRDVRRAQKLYEKAFAASKKGCDAGAQSSCFREAKLYLVGDGVGRDPILAAQILRTACDKGYSPACATLSQLYLEGTGVDKDPQKAVEALETSCARLKVGFEQDTCFEAGRMYERGRDIPRDFTRAAKLFKASCDLDSTGQGCGALARAALGGRGMDRDPSLALKLRQRLCDRRDYAACAAIGKMYAHGLGVTKDTTQALAYLDKACTSSKTGEGCTEEGLMYEWGEGTKTDKERAKKLYTTACDKGSRLGCYFNGVFLRYSKEGNPEEAAKLFTIACEQRVADACAQLATMYSSGRGVKRDTKKANEMTLAACRSGSPAACIDGEGRLAKLIAPEDTTIVEGFSKAEERCREIDIEGDSRSRREGCFWGGWLFEHGLGITDGKLVRKDRDVVRAREIYQIGCDHGDQGSCTQLGGLLNAPRQPAKDKERGLEYLRQSCHAHDISACDLMKAISEKH